MLALAAGVAGTQAALAVVDCTLGPKPRCEGTGGEDDFVGEDINDGVKDAKDEIFGKGGRDGSDGNAGNDTMLSGGGVDGEINDFKGDDGSAFLSGGSGNNTVHGDGDDLINAFQSGPGDKENIFGDGGNDTIQAADGEKDIIDCGSGNNDTVVFDNGMDTVENCENHTAVL